VEKRTGNMKHVEGVCAPARSRMAAATGSCHILTSLQTFTSIKTNRMGSLIETKCQSVYLVLYLQCRVISEPQKCYHMS
jgi:hypothetical protein